MKKSAATSLAIHVIAAILLFSITFPQAIPVIPAAVHILVPNIPRPLKQEGGGGARQPLPATRGRIEVATPRIFIPPSVVHNEAPKLVVLAGLNELPEFNLNVPQIGDPNGSNGILSGGPGIAGIGSGGPGGVGPGKGPRQGSGESAPRPKLTRDPEVIYKEEPEFTDEARKARHEGTVLLAIEVDTAGRAINIRVIRGLGLGLDERAITAVSHWKFRPALSGDRPVIAPATVAVTFHLL
jgi:protein TonB